MSQHISIVRLAFCIVVLCLTTGAARASYQLAVLANNPVAFYQMDESSGTTMVDAIAANNGTYSSGVSLNATGPQSPNFFGMGVTNPAAAFDGTVNSKSVVSTVSGLSTTAYSMEMWFNYSSNKLQYLLGRGSGASVSYDSIGLNNNNLGFFNGTASTFGTDFVPVSFNAWHQVVFTRNGTAVNLYLDGVLKISGTFSNTFGASTRIVVGDRPADLGALNPTGIFDELSLYNTELSASQVLAHYNAALPEPASLAMLSSVIGIVQMRRRVR